MIKRLHDLSGEKSFRKRPQIADRPEPLKRNQANKAHPSIDAPIEPIDMELVDEGGCEKLWMAVLQQALVDAVQCEKDSAERIEALAFLISGTLYFDWICAAACVNADTIRRRAKTLLTPEDTWRHCLTAH